LSKYIAYDVLKNPSNNFTKQFITNSKVQTLLFNCFLRSGSNLDLFGHDQND